MTKEDQRHHPRIYSLNLIAYACTDETGQVVMQGMGRTLNVSEGGMLLETHVQIDLQSTVLLTIGLEDDLIEISGKVITSKPGNEDKFEAGIQFTGIGEAELIILKLYIIAFKGLK
ncbi:MAG: PilZ domain-containing protein [Proteobacteria bacterium]|nr:PilZ domain-containing protein [Pseudomonadota bacterium]